MRVKLRPGAPLAVAAALTNLRPLYDAPSRAPAFGLASGPAWYVADLPDGAANAWDGAHAHVAAQLGVDESAVVFAEPDLLHTIYPDPSAPANAGEAYAIGAQCEATEQTKDGGRVIGPGKAWHRGDEFSQLGAARAAVEFTEPRTRIAHIDTGYDRAHVARPRNVLEISYRIMKSI